MKKKIIGNNIKRIRKLQNMTQPQLAKAVGLSTQHIAHVECGTTTLSLNALLNICDALSITPNDLFCGLYSAGENGHTKLLYDSINSLTEDDQKLILDIAALMTKYQKPEDLED